MMFSLEQRKHSAAADFSHFIFFKTMKKPNSYGNDLELSLKK